MSTDDFPLHSHKHSLRTPINRVFALIYWCAILALLYHHTLSLLHSTTLTSFFITLTLLISDSILAFLNTTSQAFRMNPLYRKEYPENLKRVLQKSDLPSLDVFICTADPYKEPPMNVVNTALSVMAYDYPTEKVSVYVSDDGGSALILSVCFHGGCEVCKTLVTVLQGEPNSGKMSRSIFRNGSLSVF